MVNSQGKPQQGLHHGWQGPQYLGHMQLISREHQQEAELEPELTGLEPTFFLTGQQHHKQRLNLLCQNARPCVYLQFLLLQRDINYFSSSNDLFPFIFQPAQARSHSWDDKACQKTSNVNSIWHRNYCSKIESEIISDVTRLKEKPSTVGIEQVVSTKGLNLPRKLSIVKRQRSGMCFCFVKQN